MGSFLFGLDALGYDCNGAARKSAMGLKRVLTKKHWASQNCIGKFLRNAKFHSGFKTALPRQPSVHQNHTAWPYKHRSENSGKIWHQGHIPHVIWPRGIKVCTRSDAVLFQGRRCGLNLVSIGKNNRCHQVESKCSRLVTIKNACQCQTLTSTSRQPRRKQRMVDRIVEVNARQQTVFVTVVSHELFFSVTKLGPHCSTVTCLGVVAVAFVARLKLPYPPELTPVQLVRQVFSRFDHDFFKRKVEK